MYFSCNVSFASLPVFLPTILSEMGFTRAAAQGLTAPPFFLSFLVTVITPYIADRTQQRAIMLIILTTVGGVGYILLATVKSVGVRYFGVFLAAGGIFPAIANILPWVLSTFINPLRTCFTTDTRQTTKAATPVAAQASSCSTSSANAVHSSARACTRKTKRPSSSRASPSAPPSCSSPRSW